MNSLNNYELSYTVYKFYFIFNYKIFIQSSKLELCVIGVYLAVNHQSMFLKNFV